MDYKVGVPDSYKTFKPSTLQGLYRIWGDFVRTATGGEGGLFIYNGVRD